MIATLATAKSPNSGIALVLGICASDPRFTSYVNQAIEILSPQGKWIGTRKRIRICTANGCLTWPREVITIEQAEVCNQPITIRNTWYEFLPYGPGLQSDKSRVCGLQMIDRGFSCTFTDMVGVNKKVKVYCDVAEDASAKILLLGYDENGNWIRTQVDGVWTDGEYVALNSATPQTSTHFFSSLTGVQKPVTNGAVRLYSLNMTDATQMAIAIYQPDEDLPQYRRSFIPGLSKTGGGGCGCNGQSGSTSDCQLKTVTVEATLRHIPVKLDTDYLLLGNLPAIKSMVQSIRKREANLFDEAEAWEADAIRLLRAELKQYNGDGVVMPIRINNPAYGGANVCNLV